MILMIIIINNEKSDFIIILIYLIQNDRKKNLIIKNEKKKNFYSDLFMYVKLNYDKIDSITQYNCDINFKVNSKRIIQTFIIRL